MSSDPERQQDVLDKAAAWLVEGRELALVTVVETWGSSPRPVGSQLLVDGDNNMAGSVSSGCIEGAVVHEAKQVMETGQPRLVEFGVTNEEAWAVGLACGLALPSVALADDAGVRKREVRPSC